MSWRVFSFIWYLTLAYVTYITIHITLDCKGLTNNEVPGNQRLCEDVSLLLSFNKPSDKFVNNIINSYSAASTGYHGDVFKWNSERLTDVKMSTIEVAVEKKELVTEEESLDNDLNEQRRFSTSKSEKLLEEKMEAFIPVLEVINKKLEALEASISKLSKMVEQLMEEVERARCVVH
ncbi:hypothetical protein CAEBREN_06676 [Caenorhabditis brenneri]|uniref:Uncharacterized protein n=1 Tax=Caenorhabditis brenneri TaxID=135651 RepID=G0N036_CAEBE|nr:hypothetical protein CAEBREN_06676 [Caenorhabditis brenneri]